MANKDQYISISEFAKMAGVSKQAVYKRLDTDCQPWLKVDNGKKLINTKALKFFNVQQKNAVETAKEMLEETKQGYIDFLKHLIDEKNEQIKSLNKTIENDQELIKREQEIVSQQQKLHAIAEQKLQIETARQEIPKQESLLNPHKFSTEAEYSKYLERLLPRIGFFASRQDKEELEKILELMSEEERKLIYQKKVYREAIDHIRQVDFSKLEEQERTDKEKEIQFSQELERMREDIVKAIREEKGGI